MIKIKIENYQIYIDGQPLKKVKKLDKPIEKQREDKTHYFRKKNSELAKEREKNAALEKKLMQFKIKAAKYEGIISAMRSQAV